MKGAFCTLQIETTIILMHAGFIRNVIEDVLYIDVYRKGKCSFFSHFTPLRAIVGIGTPLGKMTKISSAIKTAKLPENCFLQHQFSFQKSDDNGNDSS